MKTDRRCSDGRKITPNFHAKSMKPYKGILTLRSTLRYSMHTLNEGEKEMEFGRVQRALNDEERRERSKEIT